jgi:hypothetical protein
MEKFAHFLKKKGKKDRVVDGLVHRVERFGIFLEGRAKSLETAEPKDLDAWVDGPDGNSGSFKNDLRAVALYYAFTGNKALSRKAGGMRRERIDRAKEPFKMKGLAGIPVSHLKKLEGQGIRTIEQMMMKGRTPVERLALSESAGIPEDKILEYVKMADLSRIAGVKGIRARLYHDAGFDTLDKIAESDPAEMREFLLEWVRKTKFRGIAPLPKELESTVEEAKNIERIVEY